MSAALVYLVLAFGHVKPLLGLFPQLYTLVDPHDLVVNPMTL